jgi:hypothetical protein
MLVRGVQFAFVGQFLMGKKKGTWDGPLKNILERIRGVWFNLGFV